jgi:diacylglycerol kinase family enzyme
MPKAAVIVNAGSGTQSEDEAFLDKIEVLFAADRVEAKSYCAQSGDELIELAQKLSRTDVEIIVAGGGDGTISAVAAEVIKANKTLGVLPLGTLNHFSRDLKIPPTVEEAIKVIAEGATKEIDVGEVNGRVFLNNSSIGLYPRIVHKREQQQHRLGRGKWPAAFWATVMILRRHPFLDLKLRIGDEVLKRKTPMIFVGNNEYEMEGFNIGRRARLDGGKLSLYILHRTGRWGLFMLAVRTLFGKLRQAREFEAFEVEECEIETRGSHNALLVAFDGEVTAMRAPLEYKIRAKALKVLSNE